MISSLQILFALVMTLFCVFVASNEQLVVSIHALTPNQTSFMKRGTSGICFNPLDTVNVYVCSGPTGGIYKVDKTTGIQKGFLVPPSAAPFVDDCAWTPNGQYLVYAGIFGNYIGVYNASSNTTFNIPPGLPVANGIACLNNTYCAASQYPPTRGGILVSFDPSTPSKNATLVYNFLSNSHYNFTSGLNGFCFGADGTLYAPIADATSGGALNSVIRYNINTPTIPPVRIANGFFDAEAVRFSLDKTYLYVLEEARSEIYKILPGGTVAQKNVLLGAIRNPTYIDNFNVDPVTGDVYISESCSNGLYFLNPQNGAWYLISNSALGLPYQIQLAPVKPKLTPWQQLGPTSSNTLLVNYTVYIADWFDLRSLSLAGDVIVTANDEFGLNFPFGTPTLYVDVDASYVYLAISGGVQVRDFVKGISLQNTGTGPANPLGLTKIGNGNIVVGDYGSAALSNVTFRVQGSNSTFTIPSQPVSNSSIFIYSPFTVTDESLSLLTTYSWPSFTSIVGVAPDPLESDIVYFTDWASNSLVQLNTVTGVTHVLLGYPQGLACPSAIASTVINWNGDRTVIYIVDTGNSRVVAYIPSYNFLQVIYSGLNFGYGATCTPRSPSTSKIGISSPGITVDASGYNVVVSSDVDSALYYLQITGFY